jgi:hypothetical protein
MIAFAVVSPIPRTVFGPLKAAKRVCAVLVLMMARGLVENNLQAYEGSE